MLRRKAAGVAGSRSTPAGTAAEAATGIERQGVAGAEGERGLLIAALYARVSTDKQERNETIASQLDALQRAAAEGGYVVAPEHVFVDAHHSGGRLDRPALDRLRGPAEPLPTGRGQPRVARHRGWLPGGGPWRVWAGTSSR